jgi:hypothetical protein
MIMFKFKSTWHKLTQGRALKNHAVRDFSEGARLPQWLDASEN